MTIYTIKITENEADEVVKGNKMFVFRNADLGVKAGDQIRFRVMFKTKPRPHAIEKYNYVATYASTDAPIQKGFAVIGIRRTA